MKNQVIIQVAGLGVPLRHPTKNLAAGYEWRWSSDPDVSPDSPVHVLGSQKEVERFIRLAVDKRFLDANMIEIIPVVADDSNTVSREMAIAAGADAENWNIIRVALVISGNSKHGPIMDEIEWAGARDEYAEGQHMMESHEHAKRRGIGHPSIFHQNESGHIMRAANFLDEHYRQMRPSLRAAQEFNKGMERALLELDVENINPDRAKVYLQQLRDGLVDRVLVEQHTAKDTLRQEGSHSPEQDDPTPTGPSMRMH